MVNGRKDYISIAILSMVNLLNYADRYTIAGVLTQVQSFYHINDSMAGLIQTMFVGVYLIWWPLCGYLGDRFSRKLIIIVGVTLWLAAVISSSFVPAQLFWMFLVFRGILGIGVASFSNVYPAMISDMFSNEARTRMYMLFYFAIPVGSGLGFAVGTTFTSLMGEWQWGIRITTIIGIVLLMLLVVLADEPERGAAEANLGAHLQQEGVSWYWQDVKALISIRTYISCTFAYAALTFVTGTLSWWEPTIIKHSIAWNLRLNDTRLLPNYQKNQVGLIFGAITTVSDLIGVSMGTLLAEMLRHGRGIFRSLKTERTQPIVSGLGALFAAPLVLVIIIIGHKSIITLWILIFFVITLLCFNWSLNADVLMVSDAIRGSIKTLEAQYISLIKCSSVTVVLLCISAALYMVCAAVLPRDQMKFRRRLGMISTPLEKPPSSNASSEKLNKAVEEEHHERREDGV